MKVIKMCASILVAGALLFGANLSTFAAEDNEAREVDDIYKTCYSANYIVTINEKEETYEVFSIGKTISWTADKVEDNEQEVYTSHNVFARKTPNIEDKTELCVPAGTEIKLLATSENGWDIIEYEDEWYFMWYKYITDEKPVIIASEKKTVAYIPTEVKEVADTTAITTQEEETTTEETTVEEAQSGYTLVGNFQLTAYEWTGNACANGNYPTTGYTVASNYFALGTKIYIEGYGEYVVEDRGGMSSNVIDIYMGDVSTCLQFGRRNANIYIVN